MGEVTKRRRGRSVPFDRERMRQRRIEAGLSQFELAETTGLSTSLVSALECGDCGPSPKTLAVLASVLDCQTCDLLRREEGGDGVVRQVESGRLG